MEFLAYMYIGITVKYPLISSDFNGNLFFSVQTFGKYSDIKFHDNPPGGTPVIPYRQTDRQTDRQTCRR